MAAHLACESRLYLHNQIRGVRELQNYGDALSIISPEQETPHRSAFSFVDFRNMPPTLVDRCPRTQCARDRSDALPANLREELAARFAL